MTSILFFASSTSQRSLSEWKRLMQAKVAIDEPGGKRNLVKNINAQHKVLKRPIIKVSVIMGLFKTLCWALIFLNKIMLAKMLGVFRVFDLSCYHLLPTNVTCFTSQINDFLLILPERFSVTISALICIPTNLPQEVIPPLLLHDTPLRISKTNYRHNTGNLRWTHSRDWVAWQIKSGAVEVFDWAFLRHCKGCWGELIGFKLHQNTSNL